MNMNAGQQIKQTNQESQTGYWDQTELPVTYCSKVDAG